MSAQAQSGTGEGDRTTTVGPPTGGGGVLTPEEIARFRSEGFVAIDRPVVPAKDVAELKELLDRLFEHSSELPARNLHDLSASPEAQNPEIVYPGTLDPRVLHTAAFKRCRDIATQALGARATLVFDHAIFKPPHTGSSTAWHQDLAFDPKADRSYANMWLALSDTTVENGCMRFIPGSPPLCEHRRVGRDGLEAVDVDDRAAVPCPLPAGGLTIHNQHTLHGAGPNTSDGVRAGYILKFSVDDRPLHSYAVRCRQAVWAVLPERVRHAIPGRRIRPGGSPERPRWAQQPLDQDRTGPGGSG